MSSVLVDAGSGLAEPAAAIRKEGEEGLDRERGGVCGRGVGPAGNSAPPLRLAARGLDTRVRVLLQFSLALPNLPERADVSHATLYVQEKCVSVSCARARVFVSPRERREEERRER